MPPTLQKRQNVENEPPSTNWFDLPLEMREMVIDRMDAKTRCRFAQCSKLCEEESKGSANFLYSIRVFKSRDAVLGLELTFEKSYNDGFCLEFFDAKYNETIVEYRNDKNALVYDKSAKWTKIESGKPEHVLAKYAKNYLKKYNNSIKYFNFEGDYDTLGQFNLNNLRKLDEIYLVGMPAEFGNVSKLENGFIQINKLLKIERIYMVRALFTFEQVVNFGGKEAVVSCNEFNRENIKKYLKMWKNGEIHDKVERIQFLLKDHSYVKMRNITEDLDVYEYRESLDSQCSFYAKCNFGENKTFYVSYRPSSYLTVELIKCLH